eukprot:7883039-Pyramimonas_sp.AAC.1
MQSSGACMSTFDDRPGFFVAPWEYPGEYMTVYGVSVRISDRPGINWKIVTTYEPKRMLTNSPA